MRVIILGGLGNYGLTLAGLAMERGHEVEILQFPGTIRRISVLPQKNYEPLIRQFEQGGGKFELDDHTGSGKKSFPAASLTRSAKSVR